MRTHRCFSLVLSLALSPVLLFLAGATATAEAPTPLHLKGKVGHVTVRGSIGGEQHDAYSFHPEAGRTVRVTIASRGGKVNFSVCDSDNYSDAEPVTFGRRAEDGRSWEGVIPAGKVYYIYVTAYPEARYTLSVRVD